ncbi:MAG: META domain-containing protein [Hyphomicrobium sp.]|nr:META domain-containing protein [Hyphomicrobium sp.]
MRQSILFILAAALAITGASAADRLSSLAGSEWGFEQGRDTYIQFAENDVSGFSGCNRFRGSYTYAEGKLSFGPLASTRMACSPEQLEIERTILQLLEATKAAEATHKTLKLQDGTGAALATLNRRDFD